MEILAVDDEKLALASLTDAIKEAEPTANLTSFSNPMNALAWIQTNYCDVAFLDIQMRGIMGLELALKLKEFCPHINIIFVTGYDEYLFAAVSQRCSGYLLKPVQTKQVKEELQNLRNPVRCTQKKIHAQTFGNFTLFVDDVPVRFDSARSKELLAFLIDKRGAVMGNGEIAAVIWEGNDNTFSVQAQMRKAKQSLIESLKAAGIAEIVRMNRRDIAVDTTKLSCDYWQLMDGDTRALNSFSGEYMSDYGWAELTLGMLTRN